MIILHWDVSLVTLCVFRHSGNFIASLQEDLGESAIVRLHWLLPSFLGFFLLSSPAEAARLQFWRFNASNNQLVFTTDDGVQPRAQLIANPTRLVIDLPGTTLGRSTVSQSVGGAIREVRAGQFDSETTRLVIELNPGYTIDPQQVQVRGATPTQWTVQLPAPQRIQGSVTPIPQPAPGGTTTGSTSPTGLRATQLENVRLTPDGFFIRTSGPPPELEVRRSRDRRQVTIDLENTTISSRLTQRDQAINSLGVSQLQVTQPQASPPVARITLNLSSPEGPNWDASVSTLGGVILIPRGNTAAIATEEQRPPDNNPSTPAQPERPAIIQAVELEENGTQLIVRSDQPITYTSGWDRASASYQITIPAARLAERVTGPQLSPGSSLLRVRLRQDPQAVVVLVQPAAGVQVGDINQPSNQLLSLQLRRSAQVVPVQPPTTTPSAPGTQPPVNLPGVRNARVVIVIDPGHGGPDPGAVGIGGLREKDVVLPMAQQVAALLLQQGIQAVLTRPDDRDLDLEPRVQIAERANASLFISIHANAISLSRPDVNGLETYYYSAEGQRLAGVIHRSILQATGMPDRGVRQARFYVIRNTSMPSVLIETGFVTGRDDAQRLADANFRSQMAAAIARGILQYVQQSF